MSPAPARPKPRLGRALVALGAIVAVTVLTIVLAVGGGKHGSGAGAGGSSGSLWHATPVGKPTTRVYVDENSVGGRCDDGRAPNAARRPATPWCSLSHALSAAPAGAMVLVRRGSYPQLQVRDFHPTRFVQLVRYGGEPVSLAGVSILRSDHVLIRGFRITSRFDVTVRASDLQILDNDIGNQRSGIYLYGNATPGSAVKRVLIAGNRVHHIDYTGGQGPADGYGIEMVGNIADVEIRGNTIQSVAEDYLQLGGGSNVSVVGNRFLGPGLSSHHPQAHADLWQIFAASDHITFAHNFVHDTGTSTGLLFQFSGPSKPFRDVRIEDNVFDHGSEGYELQIYNTDGLRLVGNTVVGSRWGTLLRDDRRVAPGRNYTVVDNIFDSREGYSLSEERDWGVEDHNLVTRPGTSLSGFGPHDVFGQPRFVNTPAGDLQLAPGSAGSGAGTHGADIGAYYRGSRP